LDGPARPAGRGDRGRQLAANAEAEDGTDAYRLVHGEADGLPGLAIDRLGSCLRVLVTGRACEQVLPRVLDALTRTLAPSGDLPVVEVVHLRERPAGALECVRIVRGVRAPGLVDGSERRVVRERGLRFQVEVGLADPTRSSPGFGLFLDQRENRARVAARARGGRWLNLFAHTGAFTAALLAAGASEVVSVDLSAAWLRWLEQTLALNGLDAARGPCVRGDGRRWLEWLPEDERFDGIVLDPPTAAAAGRRFWSVRRDLEPMLEASLARLAPRGCLLVCRNDRGGARDLSALVQRAATRSGVTLARTLPAPPGEDFPSLPDFPEGDPFEGVLVERADP
jgi:23S rRNA (cytosine1962-C5)-methyltransferase